MHFQRDSAITPIQSDEKPHTPRAQWTIALHKGKGHWALCSFDYSDDWVLVTIRWSASTAATLQFPFLIHSGCDTTLLSMYPRLAFTCRANQIADWIYCGSEVPQLCHMDMPATRFQDNWDRHCASLSFWQWLHCRGTVLSLILPMIWCPYVVL